MMREFLHPQTVVMSDGWTGYLGLNEHFLAHCRVNHSEEFVNYKQTMLIPQHELPGGLKVNSKTISTHI